MCIALVHRAHTQVYDVLLYDGREMLRLAAIEGMAARTIAIGSAGKTFGVTGFKVGWLVAPHSLQQYVARVHQYSAFCVSSALQEGVAEALERMHTESYLESMRAVYSRQRAKMMAMLDDVGLPYIRPFGSYFVVASIAHVARERYVVPGDTAALDWQFCRYMTEQCGVCAIPTSPFYNVRVGVFACVFMSASIV
jgi:aspartate/methionine/tyrosine aminotransferase